MRGCPKPLPFLLSILMFRMKKTLRLIWRKVENVYTKGGGDNGLQNDQ